MASVAPVAEHPRRPHAERPDDDEPDASVEHGPDSVDDHEFPPVTFTVDPVPVDDWW